MSVKRMTLALAAGLLGLLLTIVVVVMPSSTAFAQSDGQFDPCGRPIGRDDNGYPYKYEEPCLTAQAETVLGGVGTSSGLFAPWYALPGGPDPSSIAIGNFIGDARQDVAMTTGGLLYIYPNVDGTLQTPIGIPFSGATRLESLTKGDFSGDGLLDLAAGDFDNDRVVVYLRDPNGLFDTVGYVVGDGPDAITSGDFNSDGRLDLAVSHWREANIGVLIGKSDGTFAPMIRYTSAPGGWDDIEAVNLDSSDALTDVVKLNGQGGWALNVYQQQAAGQLINTFNTSIGTLVNGMGAGRLFNNPSQEHLAVAYGGNTSKGIQIWGLVWGQMYMIRDLPTLDIPCGPQVFDLSRDGKNDIVLLHCGWNRLGFIRNHQNGGFDGEHLTPIPYASWYEPDGLGLGEFCGDDVYPDAAIADYNHGLVVLCGREMATDLSVTLTDSPDPVTAGQSVTLTRVIKNVGEFAATGVTITTTQSLEMGWTTTQTVSYLERLLPGEVYTFTTMVKTQAPGVYVAKVEVRQSQADANPTNNVAVAQTTVVAPSCNVSPEFSYREESGVRIVVVRDPSLGQYMQFSIGFEPWPDNFGYDVSTKTTTAYFDSAITGVVKVYGLADPYYPCQTWIWPPAQVKVFLPLIRR